jgi:hypothetical protein
VGNLLAGSFRLTMPGSRTSCQGHDRDWCNLSPHGGMCHNAGWRMFVGYIGVDKHDGTIAVQSEVGQG